MLRALAIAAILADRLQGAASLACLNATDTKAFVRKVMVRKCVDSVVNMATAQIQNELEAGPSRMIRANLVGARKGLNGACHAFEEGIKGSITAGNLADYVIFADDMHTVDPDKIRDMKIAQAVVGGRVAYQG